MAFINLFKRKESFNDNLALDLPPEPPELPELEGLEELPSLDGFSAGHLEQHSSETPLPELPEIGEELQDFGQLNQGEGLKEPTELGLPSFDAESNMRNEEVPAEPTFEALPELPELPDLPPESSYQRPPAQVLPLLPSPSKGFFLGLSEFKRLLEHLHEARGDIRDVHTYVTEIGNSIHEEQRLFSSWKSSLEDIQRRLHGVDKSLFKA
ncbi:hypothetical protein HYU13_00190 [Candidatus Woesearchaeota archaeon]|nr:hypothetical protein [Candidatus Woesearchaeota archaeon]